MLRSAFIMLTSVFSCFPWAVSVISPAAAWEAVWGRSTRSGSIGDHNPAWGVLVSDWDLWHNYLMRIAENSDLVIEEKSLFFIIRKSQQSSLLALCEES